MPSLRQQFLLDPDVVFLNHGSYGATPRPVFEACQEWRLRLEREPVQFINNELPGLLRQARGELGRYLNADPDDLVYVPNATFGMNVVARSLPLAPGDEVLTTDHEYGAVDNAWLHVCRKRGARYVRQPVSFPADSDAAIVDGIWRGVTPRTRVLFLSHITSSTALRLPVEALCARARAAGILTAIDGAHAPGQIALDLSAVDADFYAGNCHKWLCSPKGAAFLYTRRELQPMIEPPVIGWGYGDNRKLVQNPDYVDALQWLGTNDLAAYLAVPAAIAFQERHDWPQVRAECHRLLGGAIQRVSELTGLAPLYRTDRHYVQMAVNALPRIDDLAAFNRNLFDRHRVEIPCIEWNGRQFLRISLQGYNTPADIDALLAALEVEFPQRR
ncbi:MAG: aminotransferase class V-fold PLP-dependent enzyme [Gammaproteobacteria bacterium]|nr:aminotransferase class V-fold PLP-dependent enzyme [Gammaproteobacteria bacterium]